MRRSWLLGLIVCTGLIHLATLSVESTVLHWIFKLLPMALIITLVICSVPDGHDQAVYRKLILTGLLFSLLGDAFLLLPDDPWFVFGLGAFLTGHLFYVTAMVARWFKQQSGMSWFSVLAGLIIVIYSVLLGSRFYERISGDESLSGLWIPVVVYITVIGVMCFTAIMSRNTFAVVGAILFVASDSILAWNKFVADVPYSSLLIMSTYFSAQLLIASSVQKVKNIGAATSKHKSIPL
ncbi:lysoplasmalogenase [Bacillus sp. FJAT-28004]|uniref:lysoplasmalogenase n=1 Tax=Bacillus sp. FJAT-28004 TaxID=1679165 RepID=UPI0006B58ED6|nr:lysoplasmalogenase [Bacillus sp. FJAT-28004]